MEAVLRHGGTITYSLVLLKAASSRAPIPKIRHLHLERTR
ncbi:hypothetical protein BTZ20_2927 [Rhodococcus sp. MTM3W5.2]|nr:hypothetical protein BTZ20_2927 [Rhodococcus sp. MTM3W5.2]